MGVTVLLALYKDSMLSTELPRTIRILKESVCPLLLILGFCNGFLFSSRFIVYTVQKCRAVWRYTSHISNKQSEGTHCVPFLLGNNGLNVFMIHIHYHNDYDYNDVMGCDWRWCVGWNKQIWWMAAIRMPWMSRGFQVKGVNSSEPLWSRCHIDCYLSVCQ